MKKIIACLALVLGMTGVAVATNALPASAYLTECYAHSFVDDGSGYQGGNISTCYNHANNGGLNQQRVYVTCVTDSLPHVYAYTATGPWVNQGENSIVYCYGYNHTGSVTYQLR